MAQDQAKLRSTLLIAVGLGILHPIPDLRQLNREDFRSLSPAPTNLLLGYYRVLLVLNKLLLSRHGSL